MKLGFGQIEAAIASIHGVRGDRMKPLKARLRYLQQRVDIGIPRAGGGRRANFEVGHAFLFAFAYQLERNGLSPEQVADLMSGNATILCKALHVVASRQGDASRPVLTYLVPDALNYLSWPEDTQFDISSATFDWAEADQLNIAEMFRRGLSHLAIINLTEVTSALVEKLADQSDQADLYAQLLQWAKEGEGE